MQLHELVPATKRKSAKRIGLGGKRGKTVPQIATALGVSVVTVRTRILEVTGGEKLWATGPHAGKRRKRKRYTWTEIEN